MKTCLIILLAALAITATLTHSTTAQAGDITAKIDSGPACGWAGPYVPVYWRYSPAYNVNYIYSHGGYIWNSFYWLYRINYTDHYWAVNAYC